MASSHPSASSDATTTSSHTHETCTESSLHGAKGSKEHVIVLELLPARTPTRGLNSNAGAGGAASAVVATPLLALALPPSPPRETVRDDAVSTDGDVRDVSPGGENSKRRGASDELVTCAWVSK